jgi:multiple sugar transport system permease protein
MVYPLIDVIIYSFEEGYNSVSQTYFGVGFYNYGYVLRDPFFLQAIKNTLILVFITVPLSTAISLAISVALASIKKLRELFQTVYFLPYVTNTLAVGLVFMILFKPTAYSDGLVNLFLSIFGISPIDFIDGPYWAKMLTLCAYTIWVVMPFKILILTTAIASVKQVVAFEKLRAWSGFTDLSEELQAAAIARLEHTDKTLQELADYLKVSKSCLNHRMRKLMQLAENM